MLMATDTPAGRAAAVADLHAEQQTIGAVLIDPAALTLARSAGLLAVHFADPDHRAFWSAIESLSGRGAPTDMVTVFEELCRHDSPDAHGGLAYLHELCEACGATKAAGITAAVVVDKARRRQALRLAEQLRDAAMADGSSAALEANLDRVAEALERQIESRKTPAPVAPAFRAVPVNDLADDRPPAPTYAWDGLVPHRHVTVLTGHGGVGKSVAAAMFVVSIATGRPLFGIPTTRARVAFFSGEDGADLLRHRLLWICQGLDIEPADLDGWVHILDATEGDPTLFAEVAVDGRRVGTTTATYSALRQYLDQHQVDVLVVDNMSDTFDANEIERPKVRAFMRALVQLRESRALTVLLLAHVDKGTARGERVGTESYSGSTALHNSARSRLFVWKDKDGALVIEHQKHNLGPLRAPLRLDWPLDGLPQAQTPPNGYLQAIAATVDLKALLALIVEFHDRGEYVATATNSPASATRLLAGERGYPKARKATEVQAMLRDAERDGLLVRTKYRGTDRHERERWEVTGAGRVLIGKPAGSAGSAGGGHVS